MLGLNVLIFYTVSAFHSLDNSQELKGWCQKKKRFDSKFFEMILEAFANKNNEFIIITLIQIKNRLNNEKIWTLKLQSY